MPVARRRPPVPAAGAAEAVALHYGDWEPRLSDPVSHGAACQAINTD